MSSQEPAVLDLQQLRPFVDLMREHVGVPLTVVAPTESGEPIEANGQVIGRLRAAGTSKLELQALAALLGWAADRQLTVTDLTRQSARLWQELNFFHRMSRRLDEMPNPEEAMPALVEALTRLLGSKFGWIMLNVPEERHWTVGGEPEPPGLLELARSVQATGTGLALTRVSQLPMPVSAEVRDRLSALFPLVLAPLVDAGQLVGVVAIAGPNRGVPYSSFAVKLLYSSAAMAIGVVRRERMIRQAQSAAELRRELEVARSIQQTLRPRRPLEGTGLQCWGWCREATIVGGDLYGWWHSEGLDKPTWFYVGDVSGHGVGAALFMSNAYAILRALCQEEDSPAVVADCLNEILHEDIAQSGQYLTLSLLRFDPSSRRLQYVGLGHPPLLLLRRDAERPEVLEGEGMPAGLFLGTHNQQADWPVSPGDLVLAYTDGITESSAPDGEHFGLDRLADLMVAHRARPLAEVGNAILESLDTFTGPSAPADDQTLMLVRF